MQRTPAQYNADLLATRAPMQQAIDKSVIPIVPSGMSEAAFGQVPDSQVLRMATINDQLASTAGDFTSVDPLDAKYEIRRKLVDPATGIVPGVGMAYDSPEFQAYVKRKMMTETLAQFKTFLFNQMDLSEPAKRAYWERLYPEYVEEYKKGMAMQVADMGRTALLQMNGVQNEDDMWFLFKKSHGYQWNIPTNWTNPNQAKGLTNLDDRFWDYWTGPAAQRGTRPLKYGMPINEMRGAVP